MILDFFIPVVSFFVQSDFFSFVFIPILCLAFIAVVPRLLRYIVLLRR